MRTRSPSRLGWAVVGALAFVVGAPAVSQAQQSGIFPLAPITRERTPCAMEDPVFKLYRHQYFGYHPTCWRRFPSGWGCASPEAPNPAASFREIPRDVPPADTGGGDQPDAEGRPKPGPDEMDGGRPRNPQTPGTLPELPPATRSPFDLDTKPNTPPGDKPSARLRPVAPPVGSDVRESPPVADPAPPLTAPASPTAPADPATSGAGAASFSRPRGEAPLLALPDPTAGAGVPNPNPVLGGGFGDSRPSADSGFPNQPPKRQGLLSSLFGGLWRR